MAALPSSSLLAPHLSGAQRVSAVVYCDVGGLPQKLRTLAHAMTRRPGVAPRRVAYGRSKARFKGISSHIADVARGLLKDGSLPEFELCFRLRRFATLPGAGGPFQRLTSLRLPWFPSFSLFSIFPDFLDSAS